MLLILSSSLHATLMPCGPIVVRTPDPMLSKAADASVTRDIAKAEGRKAAEEMYMAELVERRRSKQPAAPRPRPSRERRSLRALSGGLGLRDECPGLDGTAAKDLESI